MPPPTRSPLFVSLVVRAPVYPSRIVSVFKSCELDFSRLLMLLLGSEFLLFWKWRRQVPPKRRYSQHVHGVIYQETAFFHIHRREHLDPYIPVLIYLYFYSTAITNTVAFSPQANYTNWATATCRRNLMPTCADRRVSRGQSSGSSTVVNPSFLDRSRYFSSK
jgi:hypothetical protein